MMTHSPETTKLASEIRAMIDRICDDPDEIDYVAIVDFRKGVDGESVIRFEPTKLAARVGQHLKTIKTAISDERDKYQHAKYKKTRIEPNVDYAIGWVPTAVDDGVIIFFGLAPYDEDVFRLTVDDRKSELMALWSKMKRQTSGSVSAG